MPSSAETYLLRIWELMGGIGTPPPLPLGAATETTLADAETDLDSLVAQIGQVQALPTANTVLARLRDILTGVVLATGENHLGAIGGHSACIDVTPTLTVGATYVANDYVGTNNVAMTFASAARKVGGTGLIMGCLLVDYKIASVSGELWLFDTAPAGLGLDSAAFTISDADALRCIGIIPIVTYYPSALNSIGVGIPICPMAFQCLPASAAIYGAFVTRGAPAWVNGDVTFRLRILQD